MCQEENWIRQVCGIHFYKPTEKCWTRLHSFSFSSLSQLTLLWKSGQLTAIVSDDELLVHSCVDSERYKDGLCHAISIGFGSEKKGIMIQEVPFPDFPLTSENLTYFRESYHYSVLREDDVFSPSHKNSTSVSGFLRN